uniref:SFRICE_036636 n=1 Tax=Spodoptera frugiperda TaxID=7108 RepID=A0A2H1WJL2_SPOFR
MERTRRNQVVQFPRTLSEMYPVKHGKACDLAPVFKALKPGLHKRIIIDELLVIAQYCSKNLLPMQREVGDGSEEPAVAEFSLLDVEPTVALHEQLRTNVKEE